MPKNAHERICLRRSMLTSPPPSWWRVLSAWSTVSPLFRARRPGLSPVWLVDPDFARDRRPNREPKSSPRPGASARARPRGRSMHEAWPTSMRATRVPGFAGKNLIPGEKPWLATRANAWANAFGSISVARQVSTFNRRIYGVLTPQGVNDTWPESSLVSKGNA